MLLDEAAAINLYTLESDYYKELNQRLRDRDRKKLLPFFPYLRILLSGLNKLPPHDGKIWRGVKIDLTSKYTRGKKFFWWSFSSCTTDIEVLHSDQFCGKTGDRTIFCITTERGRDITYFSSYPEGEVLLMPGYFVVKGIMSPGNGLSIIDIEELPPPFDIIIGMPVSTPKIPSPPDDVERKKKEEEERKRREEEERKRRVEEERKRREEEERKRRVEEERKKKEDEQRKREDEERMKTIQEIQYGQSFTCEKCGYEIWQEVIGKLDIVGE